MADNVVRCSGGWSYTRPKWPKWERLQTGDCPFCSEVYNHEAANPECQARIAVYYSTGRNTRDDSGGPNVYLSRVEMVTLLRAMSVYSAHVPGSAEKERLNVESIRWKVREVAVPNEPLVNIPPRPPLIVEVPTVLSRMETQELQPSEELILEEPEELIKLEEPDEE